MLCRNPTIEESQENSNKFFSLWHQQKDVISILLPSFPSLTLWYSGAAGAVRLWCSALAAVSRFRALFFREWWTPSSRNRRCTSLITCELHSNHKITCELHSIHKNHLIICPAEEFEWLHILSAITANCSHVVTETCASRVVTQITAEAKQVTDKHSKNLWLCLRIDNGTLPSKLNKTQSWPYMSSKWGRVSISILGKSPLQCHPLNLCYRNTTM